MEKSTVSFKQLGLTSRQLARQLLIFFGNRLELLTVEMQEERERFLHAILLGLGIATLSLLAGIAFTAAVVVWLWDRSPVLVLATVTLVYSGAAMGLYWRFRSVLRDWETLPATVDQLRKDRACLEKFLL